MRRYSTEWYKISVFMRQEISFKHRLLNELKIFTIWLKRA
jgi:hypothetical protein